MCLLSTPPYPTPLFPPHWSVDDRPSLQTDPHLLRLSCGGCQASLLCQLDVVHSHLRRQATQLLLARHRLSHLEQITVSVSCTYLHFYTYTIYTCPFFSTCISCYRKAWIRRGIIRTYAQYMYTSVYERQLRASGAERNDGLFTISCAVMAIALENFTMVVW